MPLEALVIEQGKLHEAEHSQDNLAEDQHTLDPMVCSYLHGCK